MNVIINIKSVMKQLLTLLFIGFYFFNCNHNDKKQENNVNQEIGVKCSDVGCNGSYEGPEFINRVDVAHQ